MENPSGRNWSDLFDDVLILIAGKLTLIEDIHDFHSVCVSWRSAALAEHNFLSGRQFPWLAEVTHYNGTFGKNMLAFGQGKVYHNDFMPSNNFQQSVDLGWKGWVLVLSLDKTMCLTNVFASKTIIKLPSAKTLQGFNTDKKIRAATLSCDPFTNPSDYALVIIYGLANNMSRLAIWRGGDKSYAQIGRKHYNGDAIYHNGLLYAVTNEFVEVFDVYPMITIKKIYKSMGNLSGNLRLSLVERGGEYSWKLELVELGGEHSRILRYLVELGGEILILIRMRSWLGGERFNVFALDGEEIKDLGNKAIFVGGVRNQSFSLDNACEIPECKPNHIYFLNPDPDNGENCVETYSLAKGTVENIDCSLIGELCPSHPVAWISPT